MAEKPECKLTNAELEKAYEAEEKRYAFELRSNNMLPLAEQWPILPIARLMRLTQERKRRRLPVTVWADYHVSGGR